MCLVKCLKTGVQPKRGNPNNPEDQEELDVNEGPDRASTKAGGASGYPSLGPAPNMGLPDSDEDKKDEESDDEDEDSSEEEPEEKPKPKPKEAPKKVEKGDRKKRDKNFYKAVEQAKKVKSLKFLLSNLK